MSEDWKNKFINKVICGDALTELKKLPDESVDCVVTSPPYWALRDYGIKELIWDEDLNCEHEWGDNIIKRQSSGSNGLSPEYNENRKFSSNSNICIKCGAWRGSLGLEPTFELYIKHLCDVFDEVKRVLKKSGTCWVNIGDTYYTKSGSGFINDNLNPKTSEEVSKTTGINKANEIRGRGLLSSKSLCNIPARFSIEMQNRGWILRNDLIWYKRSCMPSSVKDRFTVDYEHIYFFVKNKIYYFRTQYEAHKRDWSNTGGNLAGSGIHKKNDGFKEVYGCKLNPAGRNMRCVWDITTKPYKESHFATFPEELPRRCIKAGCPLDGVVLDPFAGSGTTLKVARDLGRDYIGIELKPEYSKLIAKRLRLNEQLKSWVIK